MPFLLLSELKPLKINDVDLGTQAKNREKLIDLSLVKLVDEKYQAVLVRLQSKRKY